MKKIIFIGIILAAALEFTACQKEKVSDDQDSGEFIMETFSAKIGQETTRTTIKADYSVDWAANDVIYYYTSDKGFLRRVFIPDSCSSAYITLKRAPGDTYYNLVYAGKRLPEFTSKTDASMIFDGVKSKQDGTFSNANVSVARAVSGSEFLYFRPVTALVRFTTSRTDISTVELTGGYGTEYVAGTISVDPTENSPKGVLYGDGSTSITVRIPTSAAGAYYINVLPENYPHGLKMVLKNGGGDVIGTLVTKSINLSAGGSMINLGDVDSHMNELSTAGTANCYVVSSPGTYRFKAVKGNSETASVKPASVGVFWESFGTDVAPQSGDLVTDVSYVDTTGTGYITFKTGNQFPSSKGNAVIVAKNASGQAIWSWHIWLTDAPAAQAYFGHTFLDRNLGATSATPGENGTLGLLYQWGRKDPFLAGENAGSVEVAACAGKTWTFQNDSIDLAAAIAYPNAFCAGQINIYEPSFITDGVDWLKEPNYTLWGSGASKTMYDPCPVGYRVPEKDVFSSFNAENFIWDVTNKGRVYDSSVWYPAANYRNVTDGELPYVGVNGFVWSCTPDGKEGSYSYSMSFSSTGINSSKAVWRAYGYSVRCVAE